VTETGSLNYARIDMCVPPEHTVGVIELPGAHRDPQTDFLTQKLECILVRTASRAAIARALADGATGDGEVVVTVHGFNHSMGDSVFRAAQMIHDFEIEGLTVNFT
jgi:esterase/lipase superfamily enzyme